MNNDNTVKVVGERLRRARGLAMMSTSEAAAIAGISRQALANYESGTRAIRVDALARLVNAYGVDANWIIGIAERLEVGT